jgi:TPP-dependent pyruvate/acetoin dehydrogenase alpha subunit
VLDASGADEMRAEVKEEIERAIASAWDAPDPLPESATAHVFAEDE